MIYTVRDRLEGRTIQALHGHWLPRHVKCQIMIVFDHLPVYKMTVTVSNRHIQTAPRNRRYFRLWWRVAVTRVVSRELTKLSLRVLPLISKWQPGIMTCSIVYMRVGTHDYNTEYYAGESTLLLTVPQAVVVVQGDCQWLGHGFELWPVYWTPHASSMSQGLVDPV
jgi:hypothetical protein